MATACLTIASNFGLESAIVIRRHLIIMVMSIVITKCCHNITKREQSTIKLGPRRDLFELLQKGQYFLLVVHANINFDPFPKPFYLDLIIVSFGMIGPFAAQILN